MRRIVIEAMLFTAGSAQVQVVYKLGKNGHVQFLPWACAKGKRTERPLRVPRRLAPCALYRPHHLG